MSYQMPIESKEEKRIRRDNVLAVVGSTIPVKVPVTEWWKRTRYFLSAVREANMTSAEQECGMNLAFDAKAFKALLEKGDREKF